MRVYVQIVFFVGFLLVFFSIVCGSVYGQYVTEYTIRIRDDGSAAWSIRQTGMENQVFFDVDFPHKFLSLVETAKNLTKRDMAVEKDSISSTQSFSGSYVAVEYGFEWINFSKLEDASIVIGDVFEVEAFFSTRLYGDGKVYLYYPSQYIVEAASPEPSEQDDSNRLLIWWGTDDFETSTTIIILQPKPASFGLMDFFGQNAILLMSLTVIVSGVNE